MKAMVMTAGLVGLVIVSVAQAEVSGIHAGRGRDTVDTKLQIQQGKIKQGFVSGALTIEEMKVLKRQQHKIADLERYFKRDGRLSHHERAILLSKIDKLNRNITVLLANEHNRRLQNSYRSMDRAETAPLDPASSGSFEYFVRSPALNFDTRRIRNDAIVRDRKD